MTANDAASPTTARPRTGLIGRWSAAAAAHVGSRLFRKYVALFVAVVCVALLTNADATVTVCHSRTRDLDEVCRRADILVAAVGSPEMVPGVKGPLATYLIVFDEPQLDTEGDGPYERSQVLAKYLVPID